MKQVEALEVEKREVAGRASTETGAGGAGESLTRMRTHECLPASSEEIKKNQRLALISHAPLPLSLFLFPTTTTNCPELGFGRLQEIDRNMRECLSDLHATRRRLGRASTSSAGAQEDDADSTTATAKINTLLNASKSSNIMTDSSASRCFTFELLMKTGRKM